MKRTIDENKAAEIISLRSQGDTIWKIAQKTKLCRQTIQNFFASGCKTTTHLFYEKNESFFEKLDTPEKAYWLGWVASDGNINETSGTICVTLHERDVDVLVLLNKLIGSDKPVLSYKSHKNRKTITINSRKIINDIKKLGVHPNKTKTVFMPEGMNDDLFKCYLRGYFEGDGCIHIGKDTVEFTIVGQSHTIFQQFKERIQQITGIECSLVSKKTPNNSYILVLRIHGIRRSLMLLTWLYSDNLHLRLERKYQKFLEALNKYRNSTLTVRFPVLQFDSNNILIKEWASAKEAAKAFKIHEGTLGELCKAQPPQIYKNNIWRYGDIVCNGVLLRSAY